MTSGDEKTRKTKAVRRKPAVAIADQTTRRVKAVKRRAPERETPSTNLLPPEALKAKSFRFLETNLGFGFQSDLTTDRYEVQLPDCTPLLFTPRRFSLLPGWKFEVRDMHDMPRFSLHLGLHKLVMRRMEVRDPDGVEIVRFEQRFSMLTVEFDILDPDGHLLFKLFQPSSAYTTYEIRSGEAVVARLSKDRRPPVKGLREVVDFVDAFRVDITSSLLDDRDRIVLIAAAIFMDRLYQSGERD